VRSSTETTNWAGDAKEATAGSPIVEMLLECTENSDVVRPISAHSQQRPDEPLAKHV